MSDGPSGPWTLYIAIVHLTNHYADCKLGAGEYKAYKNSPLAEQKNRWLRNLESQVSYMKQTTFMWYLRYFLYRLNKLEQQAADGACFYRP